MGKWGWLGLGLYVLSWDYLAPDSLSGAFKRGCHSQVAPYVIGGWLVTSAHLFGLLPERLDPYHYLAEWSSWTPSIATAMKTYN